MWHVHRAPEVTLLPSSPYGSAPEHREEEEASRGWVTTIRALVFLLWKVLLLSGCGWDSRLGPPLGVQVCFLGPASQSRAHTSPPCGDRLRPPGVGGSCAVAVRGPPSTPLVPGKCWQGPAGTEACWTPVSRYGNSLPQEVIQLQVQTISQKVLAKFRGDRHDGMVRGQWDMASPRAREGGGHPCTRHPCPAHAAPSLSQHTGLRTRESWEAARGLPLGSPSMSFLPGGIPENIAEEGLCDDNSQIITLCASNGPSRSGASWYLTTSLQVERHSPSSLRVT